LIAVTTASAIDVGALLTVVGGGAGGDGVVAVVDVGDGAGVECRAPGTVGCADDGVVATADLVAVGVVDLDMRPGESVGRAVRARGWLCGNASLVWAPVAVDGAVTARAAVAAGAAARGVVGCAAAAITAATARTAPAAMAADP
jgi:hypothetical protein